MVLVHGGSRKLLSERGDGAEVNVRLIDSNTVEVLERGFAKGSSGPGGVGRQGQGNGNSLARLSSTRGLISSLMKWMPRGC
jgi:hypothetical protein